MEKKNYELCVEVLRRFDDVGILKELVVVGSWCMMFYEHYFKGHDYHFPIRTRDIDFAVPSPGHINGAVDIPALLKDLGFVIGFAGQDGYIKLKHPDLIVEFLVPEHGRGCSTPYPLPQLGLNAEPLRFLDLLCKNTIDCIVHGVTVRVPHPASFALHKLLVSSRRRQSEKAEKDRSEAVAILRRLRSGNESAAVKRTFAALLPGWQKKVLKALDAAEESELAALLQ